MDNKKFKSGLSLSIFIALAIYHIMIILPFFLKHYLEKDIISWCSYVLLGIDILFLLPLIFNTYYSLEDTYLFVHQWPFSRLKINYSDIFIIDNEFPKDAEKKNIKKYGFTNKKVIIGYYAEVLDRKEKKTKKVKKYVLITPSDYDTFMIRIGGKFTAAKQIAEKLEEALKKAQAAESKKEKAKPQNEKSSEEKPKITAFEPSKEKKEIPVMAEKSGEPKSKSEPQNSDDVLPEANDADKDEIIIAKGIKNTKIKIVDDDNK